MAHEKSFLFQLKEQQRLEEEKLEWMYLDSGRIPSTRDDYEVGSGPPKFVHRLYNALLWIWKTHQVLECQPHDDLDRSRARGSKVEEANRLLPVMSRDDDCVDKSSGSVEEREEFPEDFRSNLHTELNCSRMEDDGDDSGVTGRVFWNGQDNGQNTLPVSDSVSETVDVFPDSSPKVKDKIQNGGGAMKQLDSDQPSMDEVNNGRSIIGAKCSNLDVTFSKARSIITQDRKKGKGGVKIEIPLEKVLQYSNLKRNDAARKLEVSSSTLKRISRNYGIHRWPPRNIDDIGAPQPSHDVPPRHLERVGAPQPSLVEHQEGFSELTPDRPLASDSRDYRIPLGPPPNMNKVKPRDTAVQDMGTVMIRAKYVNGFIIKFQLPLWSGLGELHQQVDKRLNLKAEAYNIKYEDDDGELIFMACDEDLQLCIETSRSSGKNLIVVVLEPKKLM